MEIKHADRFRLHRWVERINRRSDRGSDRFDRSIDQLNGIMAERSGGDLKIRYEFKIIIMTLIIIMTRGVSNG